MFGNLALAFSSITPIQIVLMLIGVIVGLIFGAIPGLATTMAIALCLPLTFELSMVNSLSLLIGLYVGGFSGGLISAILINIPGTPVSIMTCMDGYPMARRGEAGKALLLAIIASFIGGFLSIVALMLIAPQLAQLAIKFGSIEYFSLYFFALSIIVTISSKDVIKGTISGLMGVLLSMIGPAPLDSWPRFTFGIKALKLGTNSTAILVGVFAISEIIMLAESKATKVDDGQIARFSYKNTGVGFPVFWREKFNIIRSSAIGIAIGILPGIGGALASVVSYNTAKRMSKTPEKYGTGHESGIVASETANNAAIGGALIPLLSLGIPGDAVTALLLSAFTMKGLQPGPLFFRTQGNLIYFIFVVLLVTNIFMLLVNLFGIRFFVKLVNIPKYILFPIVGFLCIIGVYGLSHRISDLVLVFVFGIIGFFMKKWGLQLQPFIIGSLIGKLCEENFGKALLFTDGSFVPLFTSPISCVFLVIAFASIAYTVIIKPALRRKKV